MYRDYFIFLPGTQCTLAINICYLSFFSFSRFSFLLLDRYITATVFLFSHFTNNLCHTYATDSTVRTKVHQIPFNRYHFTQEAIDTHSIFLSPRLANYLRWCRKHCRIPKSLNNSIHIPNTIAHQTQLVHSSKPAVFKVSIVQKGEFESYKKVCSVNCIQ